MADVADDDAVDCPRRPAGRLVHWAPVGAHAASEADEPDDYDNQDGLPEWDEDEEEDDDVEALVDPLGDEDATSLVALIASRKKSVLTLGESEGAQPAAFAAGGCLHRPGDRTREPSARGAGTDRVCRLHRSGTAPR